MGEVPWPWGSTPGRFLVPPTSAREMYNPEVFGHTATRWVRFAPPP